MRVKLEESLESGYKNTGQKWRQKLHGRLQEVNMCPAYHEHNKSALTDHAAHKNHMINWSKATVIDREPVRFSSWIKEAVGYISARKANML